MQSKLMDHLTQEARSTSDRTSWARAVCRQSSHYARQGYSREAVAAIAAVRTEFGTNLNPEVGAWLMLAEGILYFFSEDRVSALDRIMRAHSIAVAFGAARARPACASWLATMEYNLSQFESMVGHLVEVFEHAASDDHQSLARACLVVADSYHYAGDFSAARPWYDKTRSHAIAEGDEATLSAVLFNMASIRAANVRLADSFGMHMPEESKHASMQATSVLVYDRAIGARSFESVVPGVQAQVLTAEGKFAEAVAMFESSDLEKQPTRRRMLSMSDMAWCLVNIGRQTEARDQINLLLSTELSDQDSDDVACIHARICATAEALGLDDVAKTAKESAALALVAHRGYQRELLRMLDERIAEPLRNPARNQTT